MTQDNSAKAPVVESASAGLQFLVMHWRKLLAPALFLGLVSAIMFATLGPDAAASGSPASALLVQASYALASLIALAPAYRLALRQETGGFGGLQVGADELRLILSQFAVLAIVMFIMLVAAFTLVLVAMALAASSGASLESIQGDPQALLAALGPMGGLLISLLGVLAIAALVAALVRFSLVQAAVIGERRIAVMAAARWTKGNVMRILAANVLLGTPLFILSMLLAALLKLATGVDPADVRTWANAAPEALAVAGLVWGSVTYMLMNVPIAGLSAYLYRGLRPQ